MKLKSILCTLIILFALPLLTMAQEEDSVPTFDSADTPIDLLASYYDAINHQDYERAYAYWQEAPNSFDDFITGFEGTTNVQVIVQPPASIDAGAGNLYGAISTVLISDHEDGTQEYYAGCFVMHKTNVPVGDATEPDPSWYIRSANLTQYEAQDFNIPELLKSACEMDN